MITSEIKKQILEAITANRVNYPSDAKHAASLQHQFTVRLKTDRPTGL